MIHQLHAVRLPNGAYWRLAFRGLAFRGLALSTALIGFACSGSTPSSPEASVATPRPKANYNQLIGVAERYLERGEFEKALSAANEAVNLDGARPAGWVAAARASAGLERFPDAAQRYETALANGADDPRLYAELGSVYDMAERYDDAIKTYRQALAKYPSEPSIQAELGRELGLTLLMATQTEEAVQQLATLRGQFPTLEAIDADLAYAQLTAGRPQQALATLEGTTNTKPDVAANLRAQAYGALRQWREAAASMGEPKEPAQQVRKAGYALLSGDYLTAERLYRQAVEAAPERGDARLGLASAMLWQGKHREAIQILDALEQSVGERPEIAQRRYQIAWRQGERDALKPLRERATNLKTDTELWQDLRAAADKFKDKALKRLADEQLAPVKL